MPTSNRDMGNLLRRRRAELNEIPGEDAPYELPSDADTELPPPEADIEIDPLAEPGAETEPATETDYTVAAPGEPSTGESFEYEPLPDTPGAWAVYPPGVPCDDTTYRITMDQPATADDFDGMQAAIDAVDTSRAEPIGEFADEETYGGTGR